jgi:hypothetical protein
MCHRYPRQRSGAILNARLPDCSLAQFSSNSAW